MINVHVPRFFYFAFCTNPLFLHKLSLTSLVQTEAYSGQTYHIANNTVSTWDEAEEYCSTLSPGARLAVIQDELENQRVTRSVKGQSFRIMYDIIN